MIMRMMISKYAILLFLLAGVLVGCEKLEDTYSDYSGDGPIHYLSKIYDLKGESRWESVYLTWILTPDPGRTAILVEWADDTAKNSMLIDKNSESCLVEGLSRDYEYEFSVSAVEEKDGQVFRCSLGDPVYVRPASFELGELALFTRVVTKAIKVADKQFFVTFEELPENLKSFEIGYFEQGNATEQRWTASITSGYPNGKPYALIGNKVDFSKEVTVYRKGEFASLDTILDMPQLKLQLNQPILESNFAIEFRKNQGIVGEIPIDKFDNTEVLEIDYDQVSLVDILYFSKLKKVYLGKNRYFAGSANAKSTLQYEAMSIGALQVASDMGVEIYHYGEHYFSTVPDFFTEKNLVATLPENLRYLNTDGWNLTVMPTDHVDYDSGLRNLLVVDGDVKNCWKPMSVESKVRSHTVEIDMNTTQEIAGFKITQALEEGMTVGIMDVEILTDDGDWVAAVLGGSKTINLGNGLGESTIIYVNHGETVKAKKIRFTVSDELYWSEERYENYQTIYIDHYNVALSSFLVFSK